MPPTTSPRALPPESPRPLPRPPTPSRSPSLAERRSIKPRPVPTRLEPVMEGDTRFLRDVQKPQPADPLKRRGSSPQLVRQRSQQYFEQAFGSRRDGQVVDREERVRAMAMVIAEVKTNVFVNDEVAFITGLSNLLSKRYQRPPTSIAITLQHGACVFFAGSFEPAYIIAIHALPSLVQTVTNKRNLVLVQRHLEEKLRIPVSRGLVRFVGVPEECLGSGGKTVAGELAGLTETAPESLEGRIQRRKTMRTFSRLKPGSSSAPGTPSITITPAEQTHNRRASMPPQISRDGSQSRQETRAEDLPTAPVNEHRRSKSLSHKKSFNFIQTFFNKSRRDPEAIPPTIRE